MRAVKGHGTENDFVLLPDLGGELRLTPELTRALTDRHAGIGADGVLRVVRSRHDAESASMADAAEFFMDYRNADGSLAEMCGNGVRVFARYLHQAGLIGDQARIATRGGVKSIWFEADGQVTVGMGAPALLAAQPSVDVAGRLMTSAGTVVEMPNPHVVVWVADTDELAGLDLSAPPAVTPALPHGQNVEFVVRAGERHVVMRVHERGVGETRSCGTGICAVVVAASSKDGSAAGDGSRWLVDVPGGRCEVVWTLEGDIQLRGPAVLVGEIELDEAWVRAATGG
jgi:diaminopimelate epimerase